MIDCPLCGKIREKADIFCRDCGTNLTQNRDEIRRRINKKDRNEIREELSKKYDSKLLNLKKRIDKVVSAKVEARVINETPILKENEVLKETNRHLQGELKDFETGRAFQELHAHNQFLDGALNKILNVLEEKGITIEI